MVQHEQTVGAGVVIGSNVFNLAALLGLGAILAGRIALHRRVVILTGTVALFVALVCLEAVLGVVPPEAGFALVLGIIAVYVSVLVLGEVGFRGVPIPESWRQWLCTAVREEDQELGRPSHAPRATAADGLLAGVALLIVIGASAAMERAASTFGHRYGIPDIVVGGLVLAAVTSVPNAVAAVYLAGHERGSAVLSTALDSNALNVLIGFLLPATVVGLSGVSGHGPYVTAWYVGMTVLAVSFAYVSRGIGRGAGLIFVVAYLAFAASLLALS
jgi:cation:H+ antiporter